MKRKAKSKYPDYPGSSRDYAVIHSAKIALRKPNKVICIYCHGQAVVEHQIVHQPDCPAKDDTKKEWSCPHCQSTAPMVSCKKCTRTMCEDCISWHPSYGPVCGSCLDQITEGEK